MSSLESRTGVIMPEIEFIKLHADAVIPTYATTGSSGMDLYCLERIVLPYEKVKLVRTGIAMQIPPGFEGQVRSRSGLATRKNIVVSHGVGTIDQDYRGEILVPLKMGLHPSGVVKHCEILQRGDRIAQLIISPVVRAILTEVDKLIPSSRGRGGFGSTGK